MNVKEQIQRDEGTVPYAYADSMGYWTIGVGRLIDKRKGGRLRDDEIDLMLANDIAEKRAQILAALPWASTLSDARFGALVNMCFQLGIGGLLGFTDTLAAIRDGHHDHAAELMLQSRWAKQTPDRARRMSRQIASGEWQ